MEELVAAAEQAAKNAKRALAFTIMAVITAALILYIDQGIKRTVLEETVKARNILDEFKAVAREARDGATQTRAAGAADSGGSEPGDRVVGDAAAGADVGKAARAAKPAQPAPAKRAARVPRGASGNER